MMTHQQKHKERMTTYEAMGLAAMLPGMIHAHDELGRSIERIRAALARAQARQNGYHELADADIEDAMPELDERPKRPYKRKKSYTNPWAGMTAEERSAEMKRRMAKRKDRMPQRTGGAGLRNHPSNPNHPSHEAWIAKMRKAGKASWAKLTKEEHVARVNKTQMGRANAA